MCIKTVKKIDQARIAQHFAALARIGNLGPDLGDGFLRAGWSDEESAAMHYIAQYAEGEGLLTAYDAIGNLFVRVPGDFAKVLQLGSHLDTVPRGGLYDGGAGIVAGIEAILAVRDSAEKLELGMELIVWRCEESATYKALYMGSTSAFGQANPRLLENTFDGKTLRQAIIDQGYCVDQIENQEATIGQDYIDRIAAHIELHIEQARKLEIDQVDIGVITSIRAPRRYRVVVDGESAHSGATPMDLKYRKDPVLAIGYMLTRLNEALEERLAEKADLVQTVGVINNDQAFNQQHPEIYNAAISKVSDLSYFLLDIRGNEKKALDAYVEQAFKIIGDTANEFKVGAKIEVIGESDPIEQLDSRLQVIAESVCYALDLSAVRMPSGAGHDAAVVAKQIKSDGKTIPTSMIFIPCRNGISHNPLEFATDEAITNGAQVIAEMLAELQRQADA